LENLFAKRDHFDRYEGLCDRNKGPARENQRNRGYFKRQLKNICYNLLFF